MSVIFIQEITIWTKLTRYWKVKDQIDTIKMLGKKLKYGVKNIVQMCSLDKRKKKTNWKVIDLFF